jgi:octaprenyl-diphosphate synthase
VTHAASRTTPEIHSIDAAARKKASLACGELSQNHDLAIIYRPIADELRAVEQILQSELRSETPWVDRLLQHNWIGGGKRIRPMFLLLSGAAAGSLTPAHLRLAAAVEMIHAATLVHDDVLDKADTRRHLPTVNSIWDNRTSVLLGDYLFSHAFYVASLAECPVALGILAESTNKVCSGEIRQNASQGDFELSESDYLSMISDKTAELCACSCRLGAIAAGADEEACNEFAMYGHHLGVAFQIVDDILDLVGAPDTVGKTLETDLVNQKPTLPVIHCLKHASEKDRESLLKLLQSKTACASQTLPFLQRTESLRYARQFAQGHVQSALAFANRLESAPCTDSLRQMAEFVLQRVH